MGNDGGSIPDRRDLVKSKPKAEQADKANQTRAKWFFCALSKRRLEEPIVSCDLGKLYNKDAVVEYLLDKSAYGDGERICGHIRSLKDVTTLKLTHNPAPASIAPTTDATERPQFACPLTLKEMNGAQPFVYISTCGCVISRAGLAALTSTSSSTPPPKSEADDAETSKQYELCPQCATKYEKATNVILLNPAPEEEERMALAMERRRLAEPPKKSKKRKAADAEASAEPSSKKKSKGTSAAPVPSINASVVATSRAVTSSLAAEEAKRKATMTDVVKSLYKSEGPERKETFMTMGTFTRYA